MGRGRLKSEGSVRQYADQDFRVVDYSWPILASLTGFHGGGGCESVSRGD